MKDRCRVWSWLIEIGGFNDDDDDGDDDDDCFYIALFSALEQTHCAHM